MHFIGGESRGEEASADSTPDNSFSGTNDSSGGERISPSTPPTDDDIPF